MGLGHRLLPAVEQIPVDRQAHGGVPFIEYYLQQFASASNTYGARLLDYLDLPHFTLRLLTRQRSRLTTAGDTGGATGAVKFTRGLLGSNL